MARLNRLVDRANEFKALPPRHAINKIWPPFANALYPTHPDVKAQLKGPTIREHARIGANATVLPGVDIGTYALIGAGSVVTKNVNERTIVAGNPARFIRAVDY